MLDPQHTQQKFLELLTATCEAMNHHIYDKLKFYRENSGKKMEAIVLQELQLHAKGTMFEDDIRLADSDREFPDIIVGKTYGIEVKTSNSSWKSVGSSIMESTRVHGVEKIYMFFGNLSKKEAGFQFKLYEDSLNNIAVTHSPRYSINMNLKKDETIFEKMNITYDEFRSHEAPTDILKSYYRSKLSEGQTLWWMGNEEAVTSPVLTMWNAVSKPSQQLLIIWGLCLFPELVDGKRNTKYNRFSFWLVTDRGIIPHALRDNFSSGGQVDININGKIYNGQPKVLNLLNENKEIIKKTIKKMDSQLLKDNWHVEEIESGCDRVSQWIDIVCESGGRKIERSILKKIFK